MTRPKVGVLALQGDFARHIESLKRAGADTLEIRQPDELDSIDGLVLPGAESTTLLKLMEGTTFFEDLRRFHARGGALYGTCAGVILLARRVHNPEQASLGLIDLDVHRNGYGRQVDSFETAEPVASLGDPPLPMVFIRAPVITATGPSVEVLATCRGRAVMVRSCSVLATTFHPELTADTRVHALFSSICCESKYGLAASSGKS